MPLDFRRSWSDEAVESFRDSWVRFVESEMQPNDAEARRRGHVGHELWRRAGELGFLCVDISEQWGGAGGDFRHEAVLHEEMARRALSGMSIGVHSIAAHYLLNHGTEDQKRRYLPRLAKGELVGAIAMTEPGAGSDLQAIRTRAERRGNQYAINGSKTFISNGFLAGLVVVVCKTNPVERARGISLVLAETSDSQGFRVGRLLDKIGRKAQDTAELFFDEVRVPADKFARGR
jgi:acyl-CoA dehydrogenase